MGSDGRGPFPPSFCWEGGGLIEVSLSGLSPIRPVLRCSSHDALDGADGACSGLD